MPHKIVDKKAVDDLDKYVDYCENSIERIKTISRSKNEEGVKFALDIIRDLKINAEVRKDRHLQKANSVHLIKAHGCEREAAAYKNILDMFENPSVQVAYYQSEIKRVKDQLNEWKNAEKR